MNAARLIGGMMLVSAAMPHGLSGQDLKSFDLTLTHLELSLDLDFDEGSLHGSATLAIRNDSDRPIRELPFNLGRLLNVESISDSGGEGVGFTQDVAVFTDSPRRQVNHVIVSLTQPLAPGSTIALRLAYGGFLVGYTETGSVYIKDRVTWNAISAYVEDGDFSILRTDAFAWPVPGTLQQSVNRSAAQTDFTYRARISVPQSYIVASAGRLVQQSTVNGRTTFVYESLAPVPFLNLPIARYTVGRNEGVRIYHFPGDSVGARRVLDSTTKGLALLTRWFGPLGSAPDVVVMEIPQMWGSQASLTGGIIQTADAFGAGASMTPVYHELSHLWNATDLDQPSARWNEGLATFLAFRMAEEMDGTNLREGIVRTADRLRAAAGTRMSTIPFARYGEEGMTDLSYRVGCLMFYALHSGLGAEAFDAAMGSFYQEHRDTGGTFQALIEHLQTKTSNDLGGFFDTWVRTTRWYDELRAGTPLERIGFAR